jgi:hypothetical protein
VALAVRFETLTVNINIAAFSDVTPCHLKDRYQISEKCMLNTKVAGYSETLGHIYPNIRYRTTEDSNPNII